MSYEPHPIDTSQVHVPEALADLVEVLAKHTHDVWARQRLLDGWRYGLQRDDSEKLHPGLVAYEQLPESEKVYDRNTAFEAIKAIVALGYRITAP